MEALAPRSHGGRRRPWQDLPSELLGLVLQRVPSHADRVRLRAVCRPWRAGARLQAPLPALLPWAALPDGSFLSLPDGEVHRRVLLPDDDVAHRLSTGSTLFLVHSDDGCSLMDPVSRETTAPRPIDLNCLCTRPGVLLDTDNILKVVVMSDHAVANFTVSIRRPQSTTVEWRWIPRLDPKACCALDMALFQEKLYVLTATYVGDRPSCLYAMDIVGGDKHVNVQCVISMSNENMDQFFPGTIRYYLVASGDRLLMVKQKREVLIRPKSLVFPDRFEVLEAVDLSSGHGRWREMNTLMGRALFLSEGCSESLPVTADQDFGPREDCIYFLSECKLHNRHDAKMSALYCGMYDMTKGTVLPLPMETVVESHDGPLRATWFFPADT
ncbi:hypothetical protein VPH35_049968 [Triticum aestivum]